MASLIEELIDILDKEYEIYQKLIPIANEKTQIIVRNDLTSLQQITKKEQEMVDLVNSLEHKRGKVIANIATVLSKDPKTLDLKTIIKFLDKQPKEQKQLASLRDNLSQVLERLNEINIRNKSLIQQSLDMIEFNMNFIQSMRNSPGNHTYTKGASEYEMPGYQAGMFDAKQ